MNPYFRNASRRATASEIRDYVADRIGCTISYGFSEIQKLGDAVRGGERIAGFMETDDYREWYLPLASKDGFSWKTEAVPACLKQKVAFLFSIGFGNGSPLPQPSGRWDIFMNDQFALSIRVVKHSQVWKREDCIFAFAASRIEAAEPFGSICLSSAIQAESFAAFGPAILVVPSTWVRSGFPATIRIEAKSEVSSSRWFQLASTPHIIDDSDIYRVVDLLPFKKVPKVGGYSVYFGDIHNHSGQVFESTQNRGCGMGTREENYQYARGPGGMDFYALTDHEWQIDPHRTADYFDLADKYNNDDRFVCLPGFEFTSLLYGHRNVYFKESTGAVVVNATKGWGKPTKDPRRAVTPQELWRVLETTNSNFITVPHHSSAASHPCTWSSYEPCYDRLVEVYSSWGSSEYYGDFPRGVSDRYRTLDVRDALNRGLHLGFAASSDSHDGHPGNAQSPMVKHHHIFHHLGSGLVGVLSKELTREAIYNAMYHRRCYATTGVPIVLQFEMNGVPMGGTLSSFPGTTKPKLEIGCIGTNGIEHIRIVKNGRVVKTIHCHGELTYHTEWEDTDRESSAACYYYVRLVQTDRESAWSSPIWIN